MNNTRRVGWQIGLVAAVGIALMAGGCADDPTSPPYGEEGETGSVSSRLSIPTELSGVIVRIEAVVSGPDLSPVQQNLTMTSDSTAYGMITAVPAGTGRVVTVNAYDANEVMTHTGRADRLTVRHNDTIRVSIHLRPVTGKMEIEVGFDTHTCRLATLSANFQRTGEFTESGPGTFSLKWRTAMIPGHWTASPVVTCGSVYQGSLDGHLLRLDAGTGEEICRMQGNGPVGTTPTIVGGYAYFGSRSDYTLHVAPDQRCSPESWSHNLGGEPFCSPIVDGYDVLVCCDEAFSLYCLDRFSGQESRHFTASGPLNHSPTLGGGRVYVGSIDGSLYAVDRETGAPEWSFATGGWVVGNAAYADEVVYSASNDRNVYAQDAETGQEIWRYTTGGQVWASPSIADGRVFVGSMDGIFYALNADDGSVAWTDPIGSEICMNRPERNEELIRPALFREVSLAGEVENVPLTSERRTCLLLPAPVASRRSSPSGTPMRTQRCRFSRCEVQKSCCCSQPMRS